MNGGTVQRNGWEVRGECFQEMYGEYSYDNFKRMQFDKFLSGISRWDDEEDLILDVSARDNSVFQDISNILELHTK